MNIGYHEYAISSIECRDVIYVSATLFIVMNNTPANGQSHYHTINTLLVVVMMATAIGGYHITHNILPSKYCLPLR